jgi:hypothetical protein
MPTPQPFPIQSTPGIKRDSTTFEGDNYSDGLWCRWSARGLPRKIAGYQSVTSHLDEIIRGMDSFSIDATNYLHMGSESLLTQLQVSFAGLAGAPLDRTPVGFTPNAANLWQVGAFLNKVGGATSVIAHPGQNLVDIASSVEVPIYYGLESDITPLVQSGMSPVSGGFVPCPPYLLAFSNSGRVDVSVINDLTKLNANSTFVTAQKIVKGLALRNATLPAALLWSLDTLVSAVFDPSATAAAGGIGVFDFNEIAEISILSSQGVVEFDSIYYWVGVDRFYMFNGIVRELPNNMNIEFFFKGVNFAQRQKVFAFKVPAWGEIWWCYPANGATECNHAVIYNTRLQTWYDTPLPDGGRSAAVLAKVYQFPFMADVDQTNTGFTLWQHETGVDKVLGSAVLPIQSNFTTHEISPTIAKTGPAVDKAYRVGIIEPDFAQVGNITCTVLGRANARVAAVPSPPLVIPQTATDATNELIQIKQNARLLSFKFESNTPGGDYEMGRVLGHIEETDGRMTQ